MYVPAAVNADRGEDPTLGVLTSHFAAVQAEVDVEIVDDAVAKAAILARQLGQLRAAGLRADRARGRCRERPAADARHPGAAADHHRVNAKFKFGGNKTQEHRAEIATALQMRNGPLDAAARRRVLSREKPC